MNSRRQSFPRVLESLQQTPKHFRWITVLRLVNFRTYILRVGIEVTMESLRRFVFFYNQFQFRVGTLVSGRRYKKI